MPNECGDEKNRKVFHWLPIIIIRDSNPRPRSCKPHFKIKHEETSLGSWSDFPNDFMGRGVVDFMGLFQSSRAESTLQNTVAACKYWIHWLPIELMPATWTGTWDSGREWRRWQGRNEKGFRTPSQYLQSLILYELHMEGNWNTHTPL